MYDIYIPEFIPFIDLACCKRVIHVYMHPAVDADDYIFVYEYMFKTYYMQLPFSAFECDMLTVMNVTPSQFHPNN